MHALTNWIKGYSLPAILLSIILLCIPIDVALRPSFLSDTTIVNYIIVFLDIFLIFRIFKRETFFINNSIVLVFTYIIYSLPFLIPDLTLFYYSGTRFIGLINCSILFILLSNYSFNQKEKEVFINMASISIFITSLFFYFYADFTSLAYSDRIFLKIGTTIDPNTLGTNLCISSAALFTIFIKEKLNTVKCFIVFFAFMQLFGILFLLGSRGAILGNIIVFISGLAFNSNHIARTQRIAYLFFIVITILIIIGICFSLKNYLSENMLNRYSIENIVKGQGSGRFPIWKNAFNNWTNFSFKELLFGTGFGTFPFVFPNSRMASHNIYLNIIIESGILGFFIFIGLLYSLLKMAYVNNNCWGFSSLLGLCVCGLSLEMQTLRVFWISMWICTLKIDFNGDLNENKQIKN